MNVEILKEYVQLMGRKATWKGLKEFAQMMQDIRDWEDSRIGYM